MSVLDSFNLSGRRALITGSSRGIGRAIALGLAESGADVAIHYASREDAARVVADKIAALGSRATMVQADLADGNAAQRLYDKAAADLGDIDILVSNASVQLPESWRDVSAERFDHQMMVNVRVTFELIQRAAPAMIEQRWGRILTIGSVQESRRHPEMMAYGASKCAQTAMVRNFAQQFAPHGVTANNLAPGVIDTDRNRDRLAEPAMRQRVLDRIPAGRFGVPDDCVAAALLLCSDAGQYITGQSLYVDGGMSL